MIGLLAGIVLAPLLPGTIQTLKARAQGRRGTSPLQPYRMLKRLWGKSAVDPAGTGPVYRLAPALVAACLLGRARAAADRAAGSGSATTRSCSSGCWRSRASRSPPPRGTPATASR